MMNRTKQPPLVGIAVPCYNEAEILETTVQQLEQVLTALIQNMKIAPESFIALIDDGSTDETWACMTSLKATYRGLKALKLSRNFGHQNALLAGLLTFYQEADCLISIDADLQDDIRVIEEMLAHYQTGSEIVYGVRKKRATDSLLKRWTATTFYRFMRLLGSEIIFNHADYRLVSQTALTELCRYQEVNLFLRGVFPTLGFKSSQVYYDRLERQAGESKYPFLKMLAFALDGITSFSIVPLRCIALMGLLIFLVSLGLGAYVLYSYFTIALVPGWASTVLPLYLLSGIQLFSIGVIGEYLGKVYREVKRRPRFIIEERIE